VAVTEVDAWARNIVVESLTFVLSSPKMVG